MLEPGHNSPWNTATGIGIVAVMDERDHYHAVLDDLNPQHRALRKMIPDVYRDSPR
ncbi:putative alkylhydroperoxidase [Mycobacterium xenopi 4042]|uniref:Putative alkylhydroperoxidase n=1 Tax=Mycobacterium xenopi 4042 TaxID=1299334 RepID=X8APC6_MYCXE|nr:putative alkylhydroperoxidase [Mycobacterium xenopi 4042]